jgi:hypothetical protein
MDGNFCKYFSLYSFNNLHFIQNRNIFSTTGSKEIHVYVPGVYILVLPFSWDTFLHLS